MTVMSTQAKHHLQPKTKRYSNGGTLSITNDHVQNSSGGQAGL